VGELLVDYRRPFAAIRKDPKWARKLGLGVLISLVPYLGFVWVLGWQMEYQRSVAWGDDEHLPGWSDLGSQALLGLQGFVAVLPYSLVTSILIVPVAMVLPIVIISSPHDARLALPIVAAALGVFFIMVMASTLLIMPLVDSAILRAALYGTFEAPFQFKEMWRVMREHKRELLRAWGFSGINMGFAFVAMVPLFGFMGMPVVLIRSLGEIEAIVLMLLGLVAYFAYIPLVTALGLFLGLARMHYFGRFGRIAYGLDAPQAEGPA
jgi:hypothetical protein